MKEDVLSLLPQVTCRGGEFVVTTLAAGFALAVQPVSAETITTDAKGLDAGEVKIPVKDGEMPAYRAMPAEGGPFPVVLVVQEIFGVHEHIKDVCRRLAKLGYLAVAPELLRPPGRRVQDDRHPGHHLQGRLQGARRPGDGGPRRHGRLGQEDAARATQPKLGITGFCWGGRIVWLYAAHNKDLKAGVAWYGRLVGKTDRVAAEVPDRRGRRRSRPRCSACTAGRTRASRWTPWTRCAGAEGRGQDGRDRRLPRHAARLSTPTTGPATARTRPRTAGSGCWSGSRRMAWRRQPHPERGKLRSGR